MKYFLYARKSTDTEDKQVLSIQSQLNEVREFAKKEGVEILQEFQEARTAKSPGRPIFNEMIKRIDELKKLATASGLVSKRAKRPLSYSNIHRILTNPFYLGLFVYKGEIFQGSHPPIINKELFDKVQEILKLRSRPSYDRKHYFVFRGFIRCAECGCQITAEVQKGHHYYHCSKKRDPCQQSSVFLREENLAQQVKEAIEKVALDDNAYTWMIKELERERALLTAEKVHNRISGEVRAQEVDEHLKRLLDMSLKGIITDEEYKQKKTELISRKFDISEKGDNNGDWLEHLKNFLTLAHQASYIAAEANPDAQRDFLQKIVSNLKLFNRTLIISYTSEFKFMAENRHLELGWVTGFEPATT